MWDTTQWGQSGAIHLSHDLPCARCGHAMHTYLPCSDTCSCTPDAMPGSRGFNLAATA